MLVGTQQRNSTEPGNDHLAIWDCQGWRTATNDAT
jgi:hypothetical protein